MDRLDSVLATELNRRRLFQAAGTAMAGAIAAPGLAVDGWAPPMTSSFPGKGGMILQRVRPPLLETPMQVFDGDVFTPNDRFFVRWHWSDFPTTIDAASFRLRVHGQVQRRLSIGLAELLRMPRVELAAVNQCSGNSRSLFQPRVPGAQWGHGAMGNALWMGVSLRHILERAGIRPGAVAVRFGALDRPLVPDAPDFEKSLDIDHANDGEVMIAFAMNGEQLPLLNGFPIRLIVPGWYSTYWIKMLDEIEVLGVPDDRYWTAKAYRIPDTPGGDVSPDAKGFRTIPINRMVPRSWVTSFADGQSIAYAPSIAVGGIAMGGACGVRRVELSSDNGRSWHAATLSPDRGKYGFRRWDGHVPLSGPGSIPLMARCTNDEGITQPMRAVWNAGGYMRGNVEQITIMVGR